MSAAAPLIRRPPILAVLVAAAAGAVVPAPALAGGIGLFNTTGFHFGASLREDVDQGRWMDEGGGVEVLLGDRESRLHGRLRFAYAAVIDLDGGVRHAGVFSAGAKVELLPDLAKKFGLYVVADMGITPIVSNLRTWFFADVGPGVRVDPAERFSLFFEAAAMLRYEKGVTGGPLFHLGARIAFD